MKKVFSLFLILFLNSLIAQVKIGDNPLVISSSSILELESSSKGFLPPRMSKAQQDAITSPAVGLQIWCTSCGLAGELHVYSGTSAGWINIGPPTVSVGDNYGGGTLAYLLISTDPGYDANVAHGIIAATVDQTQGLWSPNGSTTSITTSTGLGQGQTNTNNIYSAFGNTGNYGANTARQYTGGGYTDWYLPSKDELYKLYLNKTSIGGFNTQMTLYWTSSQDPTNSNNAYQYNFLDGFLNSTSKGGNVNIRVIRKF
jgi:hypothetical protein